MYKYKTLGLLILTMLCVCYNAPARAQIDSEYRAPAAPLPVTNNENAWRELQEIDGISTFTEALQTTNLSSLLMSGAPYTIFAPTDAAFEALSPIERNRLFNPDNRGALETRLSYHIAPGNFKSDHFATGRNQIQTLEGAKIILRSGANGLYADDTPLKESDIVIDHLVVHKIDRMLSPEP